MSDSIYVKVGDSVEALDLGTGGGGTAPEYVERIEALEAGQTTQDAAITAAQTAADAAQTTADNAADVCVVSAAIDGLDLVLTYGNGTTSRVELPAGKSVGDLWLGFDPEARPANVQLYAGQELSRSSYESHWGIVNGARTVLSEADWQAAVAADGFCPFYSSGDGSTTYRMPLVKGVHPEFVAALAEAGQYKAAGLPNITGGFSENTASSAQNIDRSMVYGAFTAQANSTKTGNLNVQEATSSMRAGSFYLDASLSNSIYGNSDTVQPPSLTFLMGEYVVGSVATVGESDAASLLASVTQLESNKVGRSAAEKAEIVGWGMPDYSAGVSLSNNVNFTIPCDGVVVASGNSTNSPTYYYINGIAVIRGVYSGSVAYSAIYAFLPACKGDVHRPSFNTLYSESKFYPFKGV